MPLIIRESLRNTTKKTGKTTFQAKSQAKAQVKLIFCLMAAQASAFNTAHQKLLIKLAGEAFFVSP